MIGIKIPEGRCLPFRQKEDKPRYEEKTITEKKIAVVRND